jgi:hypothetical protein
MLTTQVHNRRSMYATGTPLSDPPHRRGGSSAFSALYNASLISMFTHIIKDQYHFVISADYEYIREKALTAFARSNTGTVSSNPTQGIDVCVCLFCVVLCVGGGLATADPIYKESYRLYTRLRN